MVTSGTLGDWRPQTRSYYSQDNLELNAVSSVAKKNHISSSYENAAADDDFSPPWLEDEGPPQSSFEELDAYADDGDQLGEDAPRVMYKEDVTALLW